MCQGTTFSGWSSPIAPAAPPPRPMGFTVDKIPPTIELSTEDMPPNGRFVSDGTTLVRYPGTHIVIKNVCHGGFTPSGPPPPLAQSAHFSFTTSAQMEVSIDDGAT